MYRKLFDIKYNGRAFTVFVDDNNRKTFLEIYGNNYVYPELKDFIKLNEIYNNRNSFIVYNNRIDNEKDKINKLNTRIKFKEKVRISAGVLAVTVLLSGALYKSSKVKPTSQSDDENIELVYENNKLPSKYNVVEKEDEINLVQEFSDINIIDNTSSLTDVLGYDSVSKEDVISIINANDNISQNYKNYAIKLVEYMTNKYPDTDMRIFYENMNDLRILLVSDTEIEENANGKYDIKENTIKIRKSAILNEATIYHDIAHTWYKWYHNTGNSEIARIDVEGYALDEAMVNKIISGVTDTSSYASFGEVLDYLTSNVDYSYYDYEQCGISKLITLLKEKYPDVDIDYIVTSLDAMHDTNNKLGKEVTLEENKMLLDNLFGICVQNIEITDDRYDTYLPFINFIRLIDTENYKNLIGEYLNRYNKILLDNDYEKLKLFNIESNIIISDNDFVDSLVSEFNSKKDSLLREGICRNDIYAPLREYWCENIVKEVSSSIRKDGIFTRILDIYNDMLYSSGVTAKETLTSKEYREKVEKYKDVYGYFRLENGICPIISSKKVPTESGDGEIVYELLGKDGNSFQFRKGDAPIIEESYHTTVRYVDSFYLFDSIRDDKFMGEDYWNECSRYIPLCYEKMPICKDGQPLTESCLSNIFIEIRSTLDGKIGYRVFDKDKLIYEDDNLINGNSQNIYPLMDYLRSGFEDYQNINFIELNDILNDNYFMNVMKNEDKSINADFSNIFQDEVNSNYSYTRR